MCYNMDLSLDKNFCYNKNYMYELELIIIFSGLFLPSFKNFPKLILNGSHNIKFIELLEIKFEQYTNWNIFLIIIYYTLYFFNTDNYILRDFITVNSNTIFIIFHSFYIYDYKLFTYFPKSNNMSILTFNICSFISHILPVIVFNYNSYTYNYQYDYINLGFYSLLLKTIWAFQNFGSFNVSEAYFDIKNDKIIHFVWYFTGFLDLFNGYLITTLKDNLNNKKYIQ